MYSHLIFRITHEIGRAEISPMSHEQTRSSCRVNEVLGSPGAADRAPHRSLLMRVGSDSPLQPSWPPVFTESIHPHIHLHTSSVSRAHLLVMALSEQQERGQSPQPGSCDLPRTESGLKAVGGPPGWMISITAPPTPDLAPTLGHGDAQS